MLRILLVNALAICAAAQSLSIRSAAMPIDPRWGIAPGALMRVINHLPLTNPGDYRLQLQPRNTTATYVARIVAANPSEIYAIMPVVDPMGWQNVTLTTGAGSETGSVWVARSSIGLFGLLNVGAGPALAQNISAGGLPVRNQLTHPAVPLQFVTLWGVGLGEYTTPDVQLDLAGIPIRPVFAGHSPNHPGVDQINFQIPAGVPRGCYIPVKATVGGSDVSNEVTLSIADRENSPCTHPLGLSSEALTALDNGGAATIGRLRFSSYTSGSPDGFERNEIVAADLYDSTAGQVFSATGAWTAPGQATCTLQGVPNTFLFLEPIDRPEPYVLSDAGATLTLRGPSQHSVALTSREYYYKRLEPQDAPTRAQLPPSYFSDGAWSVEAPGGKSIASFQQNIVLPHPIEWTNRDSVTKIGRATDLVVTWNPAVYGPGDIMVIDLHSNPPGASVASGYSAGVSCRAPAGAGVATIPSTLLQKVVSTLANYHSYLSLTLIGDPVSQVVRVPLVSGGAAPVSISLTSGDSQEVTIR